MNQTEAFDAASKATEQRKNYIKLRRDEFDVFFSWRYGWRNRPPSRIVSYLYEIFNPLSEANFRAPALKLISNNSEDDISAIQGISAIVSLRIKPSPSFPHQELLQESLQKISSSNYSMREVDNLKVS